MSQKKPAAPAEKPAAKHAARHAGKRAGKPAEDAAVKRPAGRRVLTAGQRERKNRLARERRAAARGDARGPCGAGGRSGGGKACRGACGGGCAGCADGAPALRLTAREAREVRDAAVLVAEALTAALEALGDAGRLYAEVSAAVDGSRGCGDWE